SRQLVDDACAQAPPSDCVIDNEGDTRSYNKPIAILDGPGAVSSGDDVALYMSYHPHARTFGKTTNTAFDSPTVLGLGPDFQAIFRGVRSVQGRYAARLSHA